MTPDIPCGVARSSTSLADPQSIRERTHLEPGQLFVVYGEGDTIVLKRIKTPDEEEMQQLLEWGESYAEQEGITREDVEQAIAELRDEAS